MEDEALRFGLTMNVTHLSDVSGVVLDKLLSMVEDIQPPYEAIIVRIDLTFVHVKPESEPGDPQADPNDNSDIPF